MPLSRISRPLVIIAALAGLLGTAVALRYAGLDLTLSHYDARGHLIVARRIFDSITPGWQQVGAVWLPLPHLLNALPAQIDALYRTGASAVALSILSYAIATASIAWIVAELTGSWLAGAAGAIVFALNPNVLYLQATPMTEPLLIALNVASVALLIRYCERVVGSEDPTTRTTRDGDANVRRVGFSDPTAVSTSPTSPSARFVGWVFVLACMTRYEAWPVTIGSLAAAIWVFWRRGVPARIAARSIGGIAVYPVAAIIGFSIFSRIVVGEWFANGFFVPENPAQGAPIGSVREIVWGVRELSGLGLILAATIGAAILLVGCLAVRRRAADVLPLALLGTAAVPWSAFVDGHPYRIRYMVPLIAAEAVYAGIAAGSWRRGRVAMSVVLLAIVAAELRPLSLSSPMVSEAQWDRPNIAGRAPVTSCLAEGYRGDSIMASMGSLGHYMQDLSRAGFSVGDFLHEGNGDIWLNALESPRPYAGWILVEEKAEGGDMLARIIRERPSFLDGYTRVCEGAGLALYRRKG